jgi:uncharacterized iron-regulated protein
VISRDSKGNRLKYKKYNIKDYNQLKQSVANSKMGGLGANIGGEEWEIAKRKKEIQ